MCKHFQGGQLHKMPTKRLVCFHQFKQVDPTRRLTNPPQQMYLLIHNYHYTDKYLYLQVPAARLLLNIPGRLSARKHLRELHWLPVAHKVQFKALILAHRALHGSGPTYLRKRFSFYAPGRVLRSASQRLMAVPRFLKLRLGGQSLSVKAATAWNALPVDLRSLQDLRSFKKQFKTFLFNQPS